MTVTYTNRRGKTYYYLHLGKTSKGNPQFYFSLQAEGDLADAVPPGYEIYENPNSQVFLRRPPARIITAEEEAIVVTGMQRYCRLERFIVDVKKNAILIYTPDESIDSLVDFFEDIYGLRRAKVQEVVERALSYSPTLQFILVDKSNRRFKTQRYSFRSSIDGWITIGGVDTLPKLVRTYLKHLGEDSFYELY
jgi:hypothetical protein